MDFLNDVLNQKIDISSIVVWNLSRQGSSNNQKSLITSFCDFNRLSYIGSSVYSMNLARNKYDFQKILSNKNLATIPTYSLDEIKKGDLPTEQYYIIKKQNGSASRGVKKATTNISLNQLKELIEKNQIGTDEIIQPFIKGYEIEVPLFEINGEFSSIGIAGISIDGNKFLSSQIVPEELFISNYEFYDFSAYALDILNFKNVDYIIATASMIAQQIGLKDYCRIDFRVDEKGVLYCFDISSTPYVTTHSSLNFLINQLGATHSDLLGLILGAFNSNTDNR